MKRPRWLASGLVIVVLCTALAYGLFAPPQGPRTLRQFDADRLADLEVGMWQAYYAKERMRLFALLVTMLHEQYHYSWATASREGFYLARAAANFGDARGNYEQLVIPDLEVAYGTAKDWLGAGFDPSAVARAELAWWVARRIPGQDSPENIGALMARAYGLLYEAPEAAMTSAATLRAKAAKLRDLQERQPDWPTIRQMLRQSYGELHKAVSPGPRS
jgi:hypothetical protein